MPRQQRPQARATARAYVPGRWTWSPRLSGLLVIAVVVLSSPAATKADVLVDQDYSSPFSGCIRTLSFPVAAAEGVPFAAAGVLSGASPNTPGCDITDAVVNDSVSISSWIRLTSTSASQISAEPFFALGVQLSSGAVLSWSASIRPDHRWAHLHPGHQFSAAPEVGDWVWVAVRFFGSWGTRSISYSVDVRAADGQVLSSYTDLHRSGLPIQGSVTALWVRSLRPYFDVHLGNTRVSRDSNEADEFEVAPWSIHDSFETPYGCTGTRTGVGAMDGVQSALVQTDTDPIECVAPAGLDLGGAFNHSFSFSFWVKFQAAPDPFPASGIPLTVSFKYAVTGSNSYFQINNASNPSNRISTVGATSGDVLPAPTFTVGEWIWVKYFNYHVDPANPQVAPYNVEVRNTEDVVILSGSGGNGIGESGWGAWEGEAKITSWAPGFSFLVDRVQFFPTKADHAYTPFATSQTGAFPEIPGPSTAAPSTSAAAPATSGPPTSTADPLLRLAEDGQGVLLGSTKPVHAYANEDGCLVVDAEVCAPRLSVAGRDLEGALDGLSTRLDDLAAAIGVE